MTILDAHCHLDAAGGLPALARTTVLGTQPRLLAVTNLPTRWDRLSKIQHSQVTWALGLHPGQPHPPTTIEDFISRLPLCAAVGEIGLDGADNGPHAVPMDRQRSEFERILAQPATADRLVSIHSRRAVPMVLEHLSGRSMPGIVLHWFTGTPRQARAAGDLGAWFSINLRMLRNETLIGALPPDRVLVETDAPYGARSPGDLGPALEGLGVAWHISQEAARDQVLENQARLCERLTVPPWTVGAE